ncbi:MAG TPA: GrpB family protein [Acidimicrobiia bacterium]|nr:GrpB family protein [Acidimicrobiia bacterium]
MTAIELLPYDPRWPLRYQEEAGRIRRALGHRVLLLEHVGSTSVPDLAAKPIIDILLAVRDSSDEASYSLDLEESGYRFVLREPDWFEHRLFKGKHDEVNLHVFSDGTDEIDRMIRFRDHLRSDESDRLLYGSTKRELATHTWESVQDYADAKSDVIEDILARS